MTFASLNVAAAGAEIFVAGAACVILLLAVVGGGDAGKWAVVAQRRAVLCYWLSIAVLLVAAGVSAAAFALPRVLAFNRMFVSDSLANLLNVAICLLSAAAFVYGRKYNRQRGLFQGEYYVLGLFAVAGMMVMTSASHLLTLYLGLELMSLCLYAMIAYYRDDALATEAAMKYFVLGALASGVLLYGMSLLYGFTGSLHLSEISGFLQGEFGGRGGAGVGGEISFRYAGFALALVFVVVALAFKLGAAPFHMWVPDVYHGSPTSTTAFLSAAPKVAAFAMTMRLLVDGLDGLAEMWQQMLILLALLSVAVGNIIAIAQGNMKRMLAYSTVAHMGFMLFGIVAGGVEGYGAALFYVLIYAVMGLGAFGVLLALSRSGSGSGSGSGLGEEIRLEGLKGLGARHPWLAFLLAVLMFSMAGIPPSAGFFAKLAVIQALVQSELVVVAVVAVVLAVVGAFYYLRVIKLMYFDAPRGDEAEAVVGEEKEKERRGWAVVIGADREVLLSGNVLAVVLILPWLHYLFAVCDEAVRRFVG